MKKPIQSILTKALILLLVLPMVVNANQSVPRVGAEEKESTEQTTKKTKESTKASTKESTKKSKEKDTSEKTASSELETLASSEPGKKTEKKSKKKETKLPKPRAGVKPIDGTMTLAEHKAEYGDIYQQANDDYNTAHGFNPLAKAVEVDTYSSTTSSVNPYGYGFIEALKDESITKITLLKNIESPANVGTISLRKNSIEIDGKGFELLLNSGGFGFDTPSSGENPVFHLHDVICLQKGDQANPKPSNSMAYIGNNNISNGVRDSSNKLKDWYFRFGNIETRKLTNPQFAYLGRMVGIFAAVDQCEVTMYGHNSIYSHSNIFHLGSLHVEPNTLLKNELYHISQFGGKEVAGVTFKTQEDDATGVSGEFNIGKNAFIFFNNILHNQNVAPLFNHPFIGDYSTVTVEEDSWLNTDAFGPTIVGTDTMNLGSRYEKKRFHAKKNAKVNFVTRPVNGTNAGAYMNRYRAGIIYLDSPTYKVDIDCYFEKCDMVNIMVNMYNGSGTVINLKKTNSKIIIDSPKLYAIGAFTGSIGYCTWANFSETISENNKEAELKILNADIGVREYSDLNPLIVNLGFADYLKFAQKLPGTGLNNITSSNLAVENGFYLKIMRLVTNGGETPMISSEYITNAQKTYQAKAQAGRLFTGKFDEHGVPIFEYGKLTGNDKVDFLDTRNNTRPSITIGSDGYAKYTDTEFQLAGKEVKATLKRSGTKVSEATTTVLDVTPPTPIKVTGDKITIKDTQLTAKVEPNAKVFISKNDGILADAGTADASGNWSYTIPGGGYSEGDKIQIFLEDTTAALPSDFNQTGLEDTRTIGGNRNPKDGDVTYKDATFKQATIYHVQKGIQPIKFHIRQMAVSPSVPIKEIVTPKNGYVTLKNTNDVKFDMKVKSGVESTGTPGDSQEAPFKDVSLLIPDPDTNKFLDLSAVIPSNYEYAGYAVTDTNVNHKFASASTGNYQYDFSAGVYEKWVTIFIKPNRGSEDKVGFYHWDYELNKFDKIK